MDVPGVDDAPPAGQLRLSSVTVGFRAVVRVEGDIDMATAGAFARELSGHASSWVREVWVDLTGVRFLDSHGLHALQETHHDLTLGHRRLIVICPPGPVRRILELTGLDHLLTVVLDRASAQLA